MAAKLDSIIELRPGFKTAVNLRDDLDRFDKSAGYIPTQVASEILLDMGENFHVLAGRRSRLITGTYGTGKSHLALVLANIFRISVGLDGVSPVLDKLRSKWCGKAEKLLSERKKVKDDFLVVLLEGDEGPFNDSLLRALDRALKEAELSDLLPETAFSAARARLFELKKEHPDTYSRADDLCREHGFASIKALAEALERKTKDAYDKFCKIHEEVCAGAPFYHHHSMMPSDVYQAVAKRLVEEKHYAGVVVIWDEFGRYMERVLDDPSAEECRDIGRFAEACNASQKNQLHLYLICHRSLEEYAQISSLKRTLGLSKTQQEDLQKETGRFRQFAMKSTDSEVFALIDQVISQRTDTQEWQDFAAWSRDYFDDWTDRAFRLKVFPDFTREQVASVVTYGAYPLHPLAAYALPRVSERVAQNERTLFTFLSDSGSDTLGEYLHRVEIPDDAGLPPAVTVDELWNYFAESVSKHEVHRRTYQKYEQATSLVSPESLLEKRILKAIALLLVIQSDRTPCTEEVLGFALALQASELPDLREALKRLCTKTEGREAMLRQSLNGAYNFVVGASTLSLEDKVDQLASERSNTVSPVAHLRSISEKLNLMKSVRATAYSDDYMLERHLVVQVVSPPELAEPDQWLSNLGGGEFHDGYALIVVCEDSKDIKTAHRLLNSGLKHPQILVGIPKEPVMCSAILRRHEALTYLEHTQGNLYGEGAELREEWETLDGDFTEAMSKLIAPLLNPESRALDWFVDGNGLKGITSMGRLASAASDMMSKVFPDTPRIAHERLTAEQGKDNFVGTRRSIIDKLLQRDGPEQLYKETSSQHKTVIDFVYKRNGILISKGTRFELARPDESKYPAMAAVWDKIEKFVKSAQSEPQPLADLCNELRNPPYGIRRRCLSLLAASVFREYILRGNLSLQPARVRTGAARITRLDGAALEQAFGNPDKYALGFVDIGKPGEAIIRGFATAFGVDGSNDREPGELLPEVHETIVRWWRGLALFSQRTGQLDRSVLTLRDRVFAALTREDADAQTTLVATALELIRAEDGKTICSEAVADLVAKVKAAVEEAVVQCLHPRVVAVVDEVFGTGEVSSASGNSTLGGWYGGLPADKKEMRFPGDAGVLTKHARKATESDTDLLISLANEITGTPLEHWSDDMINRFKGRLESAKRTVEEAENGTPTDIPKPPRQGQVRITIAGGGPDVAATFTPTSEISETGQNLQSILHNSVEGFRKALPSGELETILMELVREFLD